MEMRVAGKSKGQGGKPTDDGVVVVKKYANRRLYNTSTSSYVTLDDLSSMVRDGVDFVVYDAKTGDDITRSVLTQIIFEQEGRGQNLLPITFLRRLIRFYGDSMQSFVPSYLEASMEAFARQQEELRAKFANPWPSTGASAMEALEGQARQNMAMFEQALRMFSPFGASGESAAATDADAADKAPAKAGEMSQDETLDELRRQMAAMQARLDRIQGDA